MAEAESPSTRRRLLAWASSLLGGAFFLWLASGTLELWPDELTFPRPLLVVAASALVVPYAILRAFRLAYVFDPLVERSSDGARSRLDRRVLYGSGWVSFFVLLVLPLKLGELSRPLLLAKSQEPGLGLTEAISGVAAERLVDGLLICGMLFGGLALSEITPSAFGALADVRWVGQAFLGLFGVGLAVLALAARNPRRASASTRRILEGISPRLAQRVASVVERFALAFAGVLALRQAARFLAVSGVYWGVTVAQLWLVARGCGLELGPAEASAIVALVGLSIQLPGGPAQAGIYQFGSGVALSLFFSDAIVRDAGSAFTAIMYVLQFVGTAAMALPGLLLLARARSGLDPRDPQDVSSDAPGRA